MIFLLPARNRGIPIEAVEKLIGVMIGMVLVGLSFILLPFIADFTSGWWL
jgi:hypothetical protein